MAGRKPTITDAEILAVFLQSDDPVLNTSEVRDAIGFASNPGTLKRLKELANEGYVDQKMPSNERLWWITDAGEEYVHSHSGNDTL